MEGSGGGGAHTEALALAYRRGASRVYGGRRTGDASLMRANKSSEPTWESLQRRRLLVLYILWTLVVLLVIALAVAAIYLYY